MKQLIIGDAKTRSLYKKLPRTTIIDPMSWTDYQSFITLPGRDIGLAPHLDSPFNRARSYTKLFDIERAGAIAMVADTGPWTKLRAKKQSDSALNASSFSRSVLVPMNAKRWVEAIARVAEGF